MKVISSEMFKKIRRIEFYTNRLVDTLFSGAYRSAFKGKGIEFEEVREYQVEDDDRLIDWNVTARMGHPFVKTFSEERDLSILLIIDVSASQQFGTTEKLKKELSAEIGATLAFSAIKNLDKVGLILFSDKIEKYIPPKKGLRHVLQIIREILAFLPQHEKTNINQVLEFTSKIGLKSGISFLISDFMTEEDFSHSFKILSKKQDLISLLITDPREEVFPNINLVKVKDLETGSISLIDTSTLELNEELKKRKEERKERIKTLSEKVGAGFLEIATDQSYHEALKRYFKKRKRR